ncbi:queuosine precursor transporter, partial [Escherichia coli]|uniref:queuosine precursor transporter n=1 Tax=Escherichia coli TaxID=562 RepID=UPI00207617F9
QSRRWWLAPTASTLFGNISDTVAFFFIAFWRSPDPFMAAHWGEIALVDYSFKVLQSRRWWLAPTASTLFGNISDTVAFFFIAFWRSP